MRCLVLIFQCLHFLIVSASKPVPPSKDKVEDTVKKSTAETSKEKPAPPPKQGEH